MFVCINRKHLRSLRRKKHYSQEQLAELAEMSVRQLRSIETTSVDPSTSTLYRLAQALDTPMETLLLILDDTAV